MNTIVTLSLILASFIVLVTCSITTRDQYITEYFKNPRVLTGSDGSKWIIEHNYARTYFIKPLPTE